LEVADVISASRLRGVEVRHDVRPAELFVEETIKDGGQRFPDGIGIR
jgi:hypothetical protein